MDRAMVNAVRDTRGAFERALRFCRARRLFSPGDRVLVGTGSGVASLGVMGFLQLARRDLGIEDLAVGAVDMGRPDDADAVADAGRFARLLGLSFYAESAEGRRPAPVLVALAHREGFRKIALGHTRDDAVARVLAQIVSGGGVSRLQPLAARRRDGVVRPLLDLRDAEALELARTAGIEPVTLAGDPSVRLPLERRLCAAVLPRLRVEVPGADEALLALGGEVRQLRLLVEREALRRVDPAQSGHHVVRVSTVGQNHLLASAMAKVVLRRLGVPPAPARAATDALARLLRTPTAERARRELVLGPGIVGTYLPTECAVTVRVMRTRRESDEGIG